MLRTLKRKQRLIQTLRLPVRLVFTIIRAVSCESVNELVTSPILRRLIRITRARTDARRAQQRQAQRVVVGFVRTIFAVGKNRHAKRSAAVSEIEPLVRRYLKLPLVVVATCDRAD